jgi:hypothetical protein
VDLRGVLIGIVAAAALAGCSSVVDGHGVAVPRGSRTPTGGGFPSTSPSASSADRPGEIESPDGDFSVVLPDGWSDGTDRLTGVALTGYFGRVIDGFTMNVNVVREPVGNLSLRMFLRATRTDVRKALHVASVTPTTPRLMDGENALEYTVIDTQAGRALEQRQTLVIRNGAGYVITYTALLSNFAFYRSDADAILDSWQWG